MGSIRLLVVAAVSIAAAAGRAADLRIGIIGLDTSHATAFTKAFNAAEPTEPLRGMRVVAAHPMGSADIVSSTSRREAITAQVAAEGVTIVDSIDAVLAQADCVLLETNDGRPHLAQIRPVLAARKPVFVDKPIGGSLAEVLAIYELAERAGVSIFSSSALRWGKEPQAVRAGAIGAVRACDTFGPCALEPTHPDLFWYGIHGVEMLVTCMGTGCAEVTRVGTADADVIVGRWVDGRLGTFRGMRPLKPFGGVAFGAREVRTLGDNPGYEPLVREIAAFFRSGKPPVPAAETIEIYAIMEAAHESGRRGGTPVKVADVLAAARTEAAKMLADSRPR
ncbi:MAG: Gfo/Idh/MocA family protein [Planctomycetaceae bacterium]